MRQIQMPKQDFLNFKMKWYAESGNTYSPSRLTSFDYWLESLGVWRYNDMSAANVEIDFKSEEHALAFKLIHF